jgi:hypothetical protein
MPGQNGNDRLDRIERALDLLIDDHVQFREEHKQLLTSQILLTDSITKLATATDKRFTRIEDNLTEITDKLNGLISYIDHLPRPPQQ